MDEASGNRADAHGSNTLTDNNTVAALTGVINNGADFELSNSEYLSITDGSQSGLDLNSDFSISVWIKLEQLPSTSGTNFVIIAKDDATNERSYLVLIAPTSNSVSDRPRLLYWSGSGGAGLTALETASVGLSGGDVGAWVHLVYVVDLAAHTIEIFKNASSLGGRVDTGSATSIYNGTADVGVGARNPGGGGGLFFDGGMDEFGLWGRKLTSTEVTSLYNSGAGLAYPFASSVVPRMALLGAGV